MIQTEQTLARILLDHPATARVLQTYRLDFCCRGERTLADACGDRGLDPQKVRAELDFAIAERDIAPDDAASLATPALIARIVDRHHGFLRRHLPFLSPLVAKVARVHGNDKDERLHKIREVYEELRGALEPHLDEEEQVLFPALGSRTPDRELVQRELRVMHADHLAVGTMLEKIRALTDDFVPPPGACTSWRTMLRELEALETDVLRHVHLENHVLMPRFA